MMNIEKQIVSVAWPSALIGFVLDLIPRQAFQLANIDSTVGSLGSFSAFFANTFTKIEAVYPGYASKFFCFATGIGDHFCGVGYFSLHKVYEIRRPCRDDCVQW